jgi:hypothetical protein
MTTACLNVFSIPYCHAVLPIGLFQRHISEIWHFSGVFSLFGIYSLGKVKVFGAKKIPQV